MFFELISPTHSGTCMKVCVPDCCRRPNPFLVLVYLVLFCGEFSLAGQDRQGTRSSLAPAPEAPQNPRSDNAQACPSWWGATIGTSCPDCSTGFGRSSFQQRLGSSSATTAFEHYGVTRSSSMVLLVFEVLCQRFSFLQCLRREAGKSFVSYAVCGGAIGCPMATSTVGPSRVVGRGPRAPHPEAGTQTFTWQEQADWQRWGQTSGQGRWQEGAGERACGSGQATPACSGSSTQSPPVRPIAAPRAPEVSQTEPTAHRKLMEAMVTHLAGRESDLPEALRTMLQTHAASSARSEAKELHKLVKSRTDAKQELRRIAADRQAYESAWEKYIGDLTKQLHTQLQEREAYLLKLSESEEQWKVQVSTASSAITKAAADGQAVVDEEEVDESMVADVTELAAQAATTREQITTSSQQVLQALRTAGSRLQLSKQEPQRDHSRTPRSKRKEHPQAESHDIDSSPDPAVALAGKRSRWSNIGSKCLGAISAGIAAVTGSGPAPCLGPWPSLLGLHGPFFGCGEWSHSESSSGDEVSPWLGLAKAMRLAFEVATDDLPGIQSLRPLAWLTDDGDDVQPASFAADDPLEWITGDSLSSTLHMGSSRVVDAIEPLSSIPADLIACGASERNYTFGQTAGESLQPACTVGLVQDGAVHSRPLQSCLSKRRIGQDGRSGLSVRFDFSVTFWFPGPSQICLPRHHGSPDVGSSPALPSSPSAVHAAEVAAGPLPGFSFVQADLLKGGSCRTLSGYVHPCDSWGRHLRDPFAELSENDFCQPLASAVVCHPGHLFKGGSCRTLADADSCSVVGCSTAACLDPSPSATCSNTQPVTPARGDKPQFGRNTKHRRLAEDTTFEAERPTLQAGIPAPLRDRLPPHAWALLSLALGSTAPTHAFTVFDKIEGPLQIPRHADWTAETCRALGLAITRVPDPTARILRSEVAGWPSPQVITSAARLERDHRAVVLRVAGDTSIGVCEGRPLEALGALAFDAIFSHGHPYGSFAAQCEVNDVSVPCSVSLPADADHVLLSLSPPPVDADAIEGGRHTALSGFGAPPRFPPAPFVLPGHSVQVDSADPNRASAKPVDCGFVQHPPLWEKPKRTILGDITNTSLPAVICPLQMRGGEDLVFPPALLCFKGSALFADCALSAFPACPELCSSGGTPDVLDRFSARLRHPFPYCGSSVGLVSELSAAGSAIATPLAHDDVPVRDLVRRKPQSKQAAIRLGAAPYCPPARRTGLEGLHVPLSAAGHYKVEDPVRVAPEAEVPNPYSSSDAVNGPRTLAAASDWQSDRYITFALVTARLPGNPFARFMRHELVDFPGPQVAIVQDHGADRFRAVVYDLRPLQGRVEAIDTPPLASVLDQIRLSVTVVDVDLCLATVAGHACTTMVNGVIMAPGDPLPLDADLVTFRLWQDGTPSHTWRPFQFGDARLYRLSPLSLNLPPSPLGPMRTQEQLRLGLPPSRALPPPNRCPPRTDTRFLTSAQGFSIARSLCPFMLSFAFKMPCVQYRGDLNLL